MFCNVWWPINPLVVWFIQWLTQEKGGTSCKQMRCYIYKTIFKFFLYYKTQLRFLKQIKSRKYDSEDRLHTCILNFSVFYFT